MEKVVVYSKDIEFYLIELIDILFYEEYFSYLENAENYIERLKEEIEKSIDLKKKFKSPSRFRKFGENYFIVSLNKRTSWFVFFEQKENRYLVQYITNNHIEESKDLGSTLQK